MTWDEFWKEIDLDEVYVLLALGIDNIEEWQGTPQEALWRVRRYENSFYPSPTSWDSLLKTAEKVGWGKQKVVDFLKTRFNGKDKQFGKWWLAIRQKYVEWSN